MLLDGDSESSSFHEDMVRIADRLPLHDEYRRVRHLTLQRTQEIPITDDELNKVLSACPHLETVVLTGVPETTNRSIVSLAHNAMNLQGLNISGCSSITDVGVLEITNKSPPLQWIVLNGVVGLTDPSISAIAKTCSRLVELELCGLPLISALSIRDIWSFSRKLRTLRLANSPRISDKAFPSSLPSNIGSDSDDEKPLPHRPITWLEELPPLILQHTAENLRMLDLTSCNVTDEAVEGIVRHAPRIQTFILSGCSSLTDKSVESICKLGDHLDVIMLSHVGNITDAAVVKLARSCVNLRCIDVGCKL